MVPTTVSLVNTRTQCPDASRPPKYFISLLKILGTFYGGTGTSGEPTVVARRPSAESLTPDYFLKMVRYDGDLLTGKMADQMTPPEFLHLMRARKMASAPLRKNAFAKTVAAFPS